MKRIHKYIILLFAILGTACEAEKIGYLDIRNFNYSPKSETFKSVLDPEEDDRRIQFHTPWETSKIQGVDASTAPVYTIHSIKSQNGNALAASQQFTINPGSGKVFLPWDHTVPAGKYVFSIGVSNEGGQNSEIAEDVLTIVIE